MFCECKCKCNHLDYTIHNAIALRKHLGRTVKWLFMCFSMCSHNQVVTAVVVHLCATRRKKWIKAPFGHYFGHHHITPYFMLGTTVGWGLTSPGNPQDIFLRVWQKKSNYICLIAFRWVSLQFSCDIHIIFWLQPTAATFRDTTESKAFNHVHAQVHIAQ